MRKVPNKSGWTKLSLSTVLLFLSFCPMICHAQCWNGPPDVYPQLTLSPQYWAPGQSYTVTVTNPQGYFINDIKHRLLGDSMVTHKRAFTIVIVIVVIAFVTSTASAQMEAPSFTLTLSAKAPEFRAGSTCGLPLLRQIRQVTL